MKIAILGKDGMLGHQVLEIFKNTDYEIIATSRTELDAKTASISHIENIIKGSEYVINCIGIIKTYIHDDNPFEIKRAIEVNSLFPYKLATAAQNCQSKVIQIATDCVFDGKQGMYLEPDLHNATDVYGKTKSLGEVISDNFLNLRCSIIGLEKKGKFSFLEWFLGQEQNAPVNGYKNHLWNGITTLAFAKICLGIITNKQFFNGLQHVVPQDIMCKADMLKIFAKKFNRKDIIITEINAKEAVDRTISTKNEIKNQELWQLGGYKQKPTIAEMIEELE